MNLISEFADLTMTQEIFHSQEPLTLESGETLSQFHLAYTTYGQLNQEKSNVIWVVHALTGDSKAVEWWSGLIGEDKFFDPGNHFIICANLLGSNYGSTNPLSINPESGNPFYYDFPQVTPRDLATSLATISDPPPAGNPSKMRMGFWGQLSCAFTVGRRPRVKLAASKSLKRLMMPRRP